MDCTPHTKPNSNGHMVKTNRHQLDYMISFMAADRAFATNNYLKKSHFENVYAEDESRSSLHKIKWEHLTAQLNGLGPPSRNTQGWKRVWLTYKTKVKNKLYFYKKIMEENPTNYHRHKITLTSDELIVTKIIEGTTDDVSPITLTPEELIVTKIIEGTTDDVSPIEETRTLDDSQIIEAYVIIDSRSSSGSNTADESPVVVESDDPDFIVEDDTILKPKLVGTTLSSKCSSGNLANSSPTTSQSDNNIESFAEENEEIEKHLDELQTKRRKISDEIIDLKQRDLELKEKLHELKEQTLELKCHQVKYKAEKLELKQKKLRMKEAAKLQKSINNRFKQM